MPRKTSDLLLGCFPAALGTICLLLSVVAFNGYLLDVGDADNRKFGWFLLMTGIGVWAMIIVASLIHRRGPPS